MTTERSMTLLELAAKVEAAEGPTYLLMCDAFDLCFPRPKTIWNDLGNWTDEYFDWHARQSAFCAFLDVGAWVDAAMMLVPEGWRYILDKRPYAEMRKDGYRAVVWHAPLVPYEKMGVWAVTPALALTAAAIRARSEAA